MFRHLPAQGKNPCFLYWKSAKNEALQRSGGQSKKQTIIYNFGLPNTVHGAYMAISLMNMDI